MSSALRRVTLLLSITVLLASVEAGCSHGHGQTRVIKKEDILSSNASNPGNYSLVGGSNRKKLHQKILKRGRTVRYSGSLDKGTR